MCITGSAWQLSQRPHVFTFLPLRLHVRYVRFTLKSGHLQGSTSCPLWARSGHTSVTCAPPVGRPSATSSPLIGASGDAHLGAVSPDALLVPGRADGRARTVARGVTPAARLCAGRLRIWRDLPDDGKVKNPLYWKCGIQDPIDESARQSSALSRSGRRAH